MLDCRKQSLPTPIDITLIDKEWDYYSGTKLFLCYSTFPEIPRQRKGGLIISNIAHIHTGSYSSDPWKEFNQNTISTIPSFVFLDRRWKTWINLSNNKLNQERKKATENQYYSRFDFWDPQNKRSKVSQRDSIFPIKCFQFPAFWFWWWCRVKEGQATCCVSVRIRSLIIIILFHKKHLNLFYCVGTWYWTKLHMKDV